MERIQIEDIDKEIIHDYVTNGGWGTSAMLARLYNRTPQAIYNFNKIYVKKNDKPIGIPNNCPFNDIEERDLLDHIWNKISRVKFTARQKQVLKCYYKTMLKNGDISFISIGKKVGLTDSRIGQIFKELKRKVQRHWHDHYGYGCYGHSMSRLLQYEKEQIEYNKRHENDEENERQEREDNKIRYGYTDRITYAVPWGQKTGLTTKHSPKSGTNEIIYPCPICCFNTNPGNTYCDNCGASLIPIKCYKPRKPRSKPRPKVKNEDQIWDEIWKIARASPVWSFDCAGNITYGGEKTGYTFETGITTEYALKSVKTRRKKYCKNT